MLSNSQCTIPRVTSHYPQAAAARMTSDNALNQALKRMGENQHELLRVLDKPYLPLHNNLSERDIRDYVKKRKISGSTRIIPLKGRLISNFSLSTGSGRTDDFR
jgi:hypothetical protein